MSDRRVRSDTIKDLLVRIISIRVAVEPGAVAYLFYFDQLRVDCGKAI